jgi:hypothetical protein
MVAVARLMAGLALGLAVGYFLLPGAEGYPALLGGGLAGLLGGLVMASWASVLLLPAAIYAGGGAWRLLAAGEATPVWSPDDTAVVLFVGNLIFAGAMALGAACGTALERRSRARPGRASG